MTDYYRIETSNQVIEGTAAGGNDTIKVGSSNATISALILNLDPSSMLDISGGGYYTTETDGLRITNSRGSLNLKLLGTTNTAIFNNSNQTFISLDKYTSANGQGLYGTNMNDNIVVNHSDCTAYGYDGDDLIIVRGNGNSLAGNAGSDTIIATGDNSTLYGCGRNSCDTSDGRLCFGRISQRFGGLCRKFYYVIGGGELHE